MKKIFRFSFVLALSLMMFSCNKEEDVLQENATSTTNFTMKSGGLSVAEVKKLTDTCVWMSNSAQFKKMRAESSAFSNMMNYHVDNTWSKREEVEIWLTSNLSLTKFTTVQEGLDAFDSLTATTKIVYNANTYLFDSLKEATDPQLTIILQPIEPENPLLPQPYSDCMDDCVWFAGVAMDFALQVYNNTLRNIAMHNEMSYNRTAAIAAADTACDAAINEAYQQGLDCLEACPE